MHPHVCPIMAVPNSTQFVQQLGGPWACSCGMGVVQQYPHPTMISWGIRASKGKCPASYDIEKCLGNLGNSSSNHHFFRGELFKFSGCMVVLLSKKWIRWAKVICWSRAHRIAISDMSFATQKLSQIWTSTFFEDTTHLIWAYYGLFMLICFFCFFDGE